MQLRHLTDREREIVGRYSAKHGAVRAFEQSVADDTGAISAPLLRVPLLMKMEHRGTITRAEAEAGATFHLLFQLAALDALRAADMSRVPVAGGVVRNDMTSSQERCRRRISEAMTALGGASSPAASAIWHIVGLEMTPHAWAIQTRRHHDFAHGVLVAGLGVLASHFAGRRATTR